jgi:plasmid maintenance system killer protein
MRVEYRNPDLEKLEFDASFSGGYAQKAIFDFRHRMQLLRAAPTEAALLPLQALRMRLRSDAGKYRMRVNDDYNLSIDFEDMESERAAVVFEMTSKDDESEGGIHHG